MHPCCSRGDASPVAASTIGSRLKGSAPWLRRTRAAIQWTVPAVMLALIPKCPACVAGYVLVLTGIGFSYSAAAVMRSTLIVACVGVLILLFLRVLRRMLTRRRQGGSPVH